MDGKVTREKRINQRGHAHGQQDENERQGHAPGADPVRVVRPERQTGRRNPEHGQHQRDDNGKMSDFNDHGILLQGTRWIHSTNDFMKSLRGNSTPARFNSMGM